MLEVLGYKSPVYTNLESKRAEMEAVSKDNASLRFRFATAKMSELDMSKVNTQANPSSSGLVNTSHLTQSHGPTGFAPHKLLLMYYRHLNPQHTMVLAL